MRALRWTAAAALAAAAPWLAGCSTLYSPTRDQQGQEAKAAWDQVDLAGQIETARANHAALLKQQLAVQDQLMAARRDQLARMLATSPKPVQAVLGDSVSAALVQLAGKPPATADSAAAAALAAEAWWKARRDEVRAQDRLKDFEIEFRRFGLEMPPCAKLASDATRAALAEWVAANPQAPMKPVIAQALQACADPRMSASAGVAIDGDIAATRQAAVEARRLLDDKRALHVDERNRYLAAKAEYDAAAARLQVDPTKSHDEVQAEAQKLKELAALLSSFQDAFSVRFVSQEQQQSLAALLDTLASTPAGQAPPADASRAAMALVLLPDLLDQARRSLADARKPGLVPLLLAQDLAKIREDAAQRDIVVEQTRLELLDAKLEAQAQRARRLLDARIDLQKTTTLAGQTPFDALSPVPGRPRDSDAAGRRQLDDKVRLWKAAAFYLDAEGRLRAEAGKVDYQVNALAHERAISYAESNIALWNTLVTNAVDQAAAWGAAGIRKEDVVALLNSLTLLWIGMGVH